MNADILAYHNMDLVSDVYEGTGKNAQKYDFWE